MERVELLDFIRCQFRRMLKDYCGKCGEAKYRLQPTDDPDKTKSQTAMMCPICGHVDKYLK